MPDLFGQFKPSFDAIKPGEDSVDLQILTCLADVHMSNLPLKYAESKFQSSDPLIDTVDTPANVTEVLEHQVCGLLRHGHDSKRCF